MRSNICCQTMGWLRNVFRAARCYSSSSGSNLHFSDAYIGRNLGQKKPFVTKPSAEEIEHLNEASRRQAHISSLAPTCCDGCTSGCCGRVEITVSRTPGTPLTPYELQEIEDLSRKASKLAEKS